MKQDKEALEVLNKLLEETGAVRVIVVVVDHTTSLVTYNTISLNDRNH